MKQLLLFFVLLMLAGGNVAAQNERPIRFEELPKTSQEFVTRYWADATIQYVKTKVSASLTTYTVNFTEGREVQFDNSGKWIEIRSKKMPIPEGIVPPKIMDYISKYFPGERIEKIEHNARIYEVDLESGVEICFNRSLRAIDINY